jgi:DNA-binding transcriptional ArsR family regulator
MASEDEHQDSAAPGGPAHQDNPIEMRKLTDSRTLRALAHPVRVALIEALALHSPLTATEVGELIGESPTTCSFHLRQLAKYDFVEEAGGGKGRARPWRITSIGFSVSADNDDDPAARVAGEVVGRMFRERQLDRYRAWHESKQMYPPSWRRAAGETQSVTYLTVQELQELTDELRDIVLQRFPQRLADPSLRPPGSVPVETVLVSYPIEMPDQET